MSKTLPIAAPADQMHWDLSRIYSGPDDPRIEQHLVGALEDARAFAAEFRGRIAQLEPQEFLTMMRRLENLETRAHRPAWFAGLRFAAQTDDPVGRALLERARAGSTAVENLLAGARLELATLTEAAAARLTSAPELAEYRHAVESNLRFGPYTLTEAEERLMNSKALTGRQAWTQLYSEITSAMRIPMEVDGETRELTVSEARALRTRPERELRRRATDAVHAAFEAHEHALTFVFNTLYQDWKLDTELRGYDASIHPTALNDELDPKMVEAVMSTVERNYSLAQDYYREKARILGLNDFSSYDTLATYEAVERRYEYGEAQSLVLNAIGAFSSELETQARGFFEERRIDVPPRPGKQGGAFCWSNNPSDESFILLNFQGRLEDVFTLAHELGHGVHAELSRRQNPTNYGQSLPLAETASVFCEMLLVDHLLRSGDEGVRREMLAGQLEDAVGTIIRQVQITRWEQRAHAERAGGVVTSARYGELWMEEFRKVNGDAVQPVPGDRWGWIGIPHVVSSRFYCYSYAFGMLLVLGLYGRYKQEGASFVPRFLDFLAAGRSGSPEELVRRLGIDLRDTGFWQSGFDHLRGLLEEFRAANV